MWLRYILIAAGVVLMVTGCNSLISQFFGTHKLRRISLAEVQREGLGDADYVYLDELVPAADYLKGDPVSRGDKPVVVYPLLTPEQAEAHAAGERVEAQFWAWSTVYDPGCLERGDCYPREQGYIQGLVRPPNPKKLAAPAQWADLGYQLHPDARYIQQGREPMAWYWNLLLFLGGLVLPMAVEARAFRKRKARADK